jgi:dihydroorotate dehydrogenase (NAD+) catalytic subunit
MALAYKPSRSLAWNAAHPPKLPARPRRLPVLPVRMFDRMVETPVGIAAGPLPNSKWVQAYCRLGYGLLTYGSVRSAARAALSPPNLVPCHMGDPALVETGSHRKVDPADFTWAVSFGHPSADPEQWRADVKRAAERLGKEQLLIVSVAGTPEPGGDGEQLARDYARCATWAAEAGADVVEVLLASPSGPEERSPMVFENAPLAGYVVQEVRRAVGTRPIIAKLGATQSPRALHDLASRLAPWLDGFILVSGLQRRLLKGDGSPVLAGPGRETASIAGGQVYEHCRVQVHELLAWRRAGAWDRVVLAVGGITTTERIRETLEGGATAAMLATGALADPLLAARYRAGR